MVLLCFRRKKVEIKIALLSYLIIYLYYIFISYYIYIFLVMSVHRKIRLVAAIDFQKNKYIKRKYLFKFKISGFDNKTLEYLIY